MIPIFGIVSWAYAEHIRCHTLVLDRGCISIQTSWSICYRSVHYFANKFLFSRISLHTIYGFSISGLSSTIGFKGFPSMYRSIRSSFFQFKSYRNGFDEDLSISTLHNRKHWNIIAPRIANVFSLLSISRFKSSVESFYEVFWEKICPNFYKVFFYQIIKKTGSQLTTWA